MMSLRNYVTSVLLSYLDKYVQNFKPIDAQVTIWGGGITLHNLVLKTDVLQKEISFPFTLLSSRIYELIIQIPWTRLMVDPVVVNVNTIECVLGGTNSSSDDGPSQESDDVAQVADATPSYAQALIRRIVSNISLHVNSLIVKYVRDDIIVSLTIKKLTMNSKDVNWESAIADIDSEDPAVRRVIHLDDVTLCLDQRDADGKIRHYNEPLVYRCKADLSVLTKLMSAHTRRAKSVHLKLLGQGLVGGINNEQIALLLRLLIEKLPEEVKIQPPVTKPPTVQPAPTMEQPPSCSSSSEPTDENDWSEWVWSWIPKWATQEVEEPPPGASPVPITITSHFDTISFAYKVTEMEGNRKRTHEVLKMYFKDAVLRAHVCVPTITRVQFGARDFSMVSLGKCVCGIAADHPANKTPTDIIKKIDKDDDSWQWVDEELDHAVEPASVAGVSDFVHVPTGTQNVGELGEQASPDLADAQEVDDFWGKMKPLVYVEYSHERMPIDPLVNPYDKPPKDFEYSDWKEDCLIKLALRPMSVTATTGLRHRLESILKVFREAPAAEVIDRAMRTLTVEECDSLSNNLPQRKISFEAFGLRVRLVPNDHLDVVRNSEPIVVDVNFTKPSVLITMPLYPHRVCSAACQTLDDSSPIWQGSRLHVTAQSTIEVGVCSPDDDTPRPCARADLRIAAHKLLNSEYFNLTEFLRYSYSIRLREANVCGSAARLHAAYHVMASIMNENSTDHLSNTTLANEALNDEDSAAIDVTIEEFLWRGYVTSNVNTHFFSINAARATAFHSSADGDIKQAWLFSGPETPINKQYLKAAVQWCKEPTGNDLEYVKIHMEPTAVSLDPILVSWLNFQYRELPTVSSTTVAEPLPTLPPIKYKTSQSMPRRRVTPPSSGLGGSHPGSAAELVHSRPRSLESSSEISEKKELKRPKLIKIKPVESKWTEQEMYKLYDRLKRLLLSVEIGLIQVYVSPTTASALDCATVRDAMEIHAGGERVLVFNLGRVSLHSNSQINYLWQGVKHDLPTLRRPKGDANALAESFPWKASMADMSCYTFEQNKDMKTEKGTSLKSQLKASQAIVPRTILELNTTSVTLSMVTKKFEDQRVRRSHRRRKMEQPKDDDKTKYFTAGPDFTPTSIDEFLQGPSTSQQKKPSETPPPLPKQPPDTDPITNQSGPHISLGFNVHADTPPVFVKLDRDQVPTVILAVHCITHVMALLRRPPMIPQEKDDDLTDVSPNPERRLSQSDESEIPSTPLITIYEADTAQEDKKMKTFLWLQWVISRASFAVVTKEVKLVFDIDDVITSFDVRDKYNQIKAKIATASATYYERTDNDEWTPGLLDGRILKIREPSNVNEPNNFFTTTITQALIEDLPTNWKEEIKHKLLEQKEDADTMWEVFGNLADLECHVPLDVLEHLLSSMYEILPKSFCTVNKQETKLSLCDWPLCFFTGGGLRLLVTKGGKQQKVEDDTIILLVDKITVTPYPDNPICRLSITAEQEHQRQQQSQQEQQPQQIQPQQQSPQKQQQQEQPPEQQPPEEQRPQEQDQQKQPQQPQPQKQQLKEQQPQERRSQEQQQQQNQPQQPQPQPQPQHPQPQPQQPQPQEKQQQQWQKHQQQEQQPQKHQPQEHQPQEQQPQEQQKQNVANNWPTPNPTLEGRQYEMLIKSVSIKSTNFLELVKQETKDADVLKSGENPAFKWSQTDASPTLNTVLRPIDICCIAAPAIYTRGELMCGPALEMNVLSDCGIELYVKRLDVLWAYLQKLLNVFRSRQDKSLMEQSNRCPYAALVQNEAVKVGEPVAETKQTEIKGQDVPESLKDASFAFDSGVETITTHSTFKRRRTSPPAKKAPAHSTNPSDYLEMFMTMGVLKVSFYEEDENSLKVQNVRPTITKNTNKPLGKVFEDDEKVISDKPDTPSASKSNTENERETDIGKSELPDDSPPAQDDVGNMPLVSITLNQPNLYYWARDKKTTFQMVVFDMWVGLGGAEEDQCSQPVLTTKLGAPDPLTDITPALMTLRYDSPGGDKFIQSTDKGSINFDVERPLVLDIGTDRIRRVKAIMSLIEKNVTWPDTNEQSVERPVPFLYQFHRILVENKITGVIVTTAQLGVRGSEGTVSWGASWLQIATGVPPRRLVGRALINAALVSFGPSTSIRHIVLKPLVMGMRMGANWEAWKRSEDGDPMACQPTINVGFEIDRIILDLRPCDLDTIDRIRNAIQELMDQKILSSGLSASNDSRPPSPRPSTSSATESHALDDMCQFYKDDLRSGAFKLIKSDQLPLAYQVALHDYTVAWRYPHPRAITRIVTYPIPGLVDKDIECVLELYCPMLARWEPHTYFMLPLVEPCEIVLMSSPSDGIYSLIWRVRSSPNKDKSNPAYTFEPSAFMPKGNILESDQPTSPDLYDESQEVKVTGEQLSAILRIDSYFAPKYLPDARLALHLALLEIHAHNTLPIIQESSQVTGYYVTEKFVRTHRILSGRARDVVAHWHVGGKSTVLLDTHVASDLLDTTTGVMDTFINEFRVQVSLLLRKEPQCRLRAGDIRAVLTVQSVRTLARLVDDWKGVLIKQRDAPSPNSDEEYVVNVRETKKDSLEALSGRISLWVHNTCTDSLRITQDESDEYLRISPGNVLAYRWCSPTGPKKLRFALSYPNIAFPWSDTVPFAVGTYQVRVGNVDPVNKENVGQTILYVRVVATGSQRDMYLSGRITMANMLRQTLFYRIRIRYSDKQQWHSLYTGEIPQETIGLSLLCNSDCQTSMRLRSIHENSVWSGDIPLHECRKNNVPWLVKVPSDGGSNYTAVWCRVIRANIDNRLIATTWPFYMIKSHLPLDVDATVTSNVNPLTPTSTTPPIVQTIPGRGKTTHVAAPGTTSAKHNLTFRYRDIDSLVTHDTIPVHYGITDQSVFDQLTPSNTIEEVIESIREWMKDNGRHNVTNWPYSKVSNHWPASWQPGLLQPRSEVNIDYEAVRAGGSGNSLGVLLKPVVLLANATPFMLTIRAFDAMPLCRLEPGIALAPPSVLIEKPFFISVEVGQETFVSDQMEIYREDTGRYGQPPHGQVALEKPCQFVVLCNNKVAMLTMYYEIKKDIHVLGVTSSYVLINRLPNVLLASAVVASNYSAADEMVHRPTTFKIVQKTEDDSIHGTPLSYFLMNSRWLGSDVCDLRAYLYLALPSGIEAFGTPVPVRLGIAPVRRGISLMDKNGKSVPVVVTQVYHEARWLITVAEDPCPQLVVLNRTSTTLAVAQPFIDEENTTARVRTVPDCNGARWCCAVEAGRATHYSMPAYCARYPPIAQPQQATPPLLTVGHQDEGGEYDWCQPIAIADGEQLLQVAEDMTIKVRVRTHPHSTLIELQDVDQCDISASDIRRRLTGLEREASQPPQDERDATQNAEYQTQGGSAHNNRSAKVREESTLQPSQYGPSTSTIQQDPTISGDTTKPEPFHTTLLKLCVPVVDDTEQAFRNEILNTMTGARKRSSDISESSFLLDDISEKDWPEVTEVRQERFRGLINSITVQIGSSAEALPLISFNLRHIAVLVQSDPKALRATLAATDMQIDNTKFATDEFDFPVIASTMPARSRPYFWPALWGMFAEKIPIKVEDSRFFVRASIDVWSVAGMNYQEITELEVLLGPMKLYIEDEFVEAAQDLYRLAFPPTTQSSQATVLAEILALQRPLRLRKLHLYSLNLTLTLHTAVRMYIALDESPLRLSPFTLQDMMTSPESLLHALTVHYLSAAILGAGWVVGGLELLGAPGALAARVGSAGGGVRGVASAAAGALLRSLSAAAGSLARNLDLLAGDDEHARRAAAARRKPPPNLMAGLVTGITNFAINILGAVGGLAHHPLVGVAVGESSSSAAGLRRGILGAITKPLSATADLVAYAGQGLLSQTGWDPVSRPRPSSVHSYQRTLPPAGWRRDCVRWGFKFSEVDIIYGFEAMLEDKIVRLLITHKHLLLVDAVSERIVEILDFKYCTVGSRGGPLVELFITKKHEPRDFDARAVTDEDEVQLSPAALARLARYSGRSGYNVDEVRLLSLLPTEGLSNSLRAILCAVLQCDNDDHFNML